MRPLAALLLALATLVLAVAFSVAPPKARPLDASPPLFSAARAMVDVRALTASGLPHPVSSPDHDRVRDLVMARMAALGLEPEIQRAKAERRGIEYPLENIVGTFRGKEPGAAVMLVAHYDSVKGGPGASDDAAGVAAIFEVLRALSATGGPTRPVVVLISDGEEAGLLGARAFLEQRVSIREVRIVLNLEARGTSGQTGMFETSDKSGWLVELYGRVVDRPAATSLIPVLYHQLPNDTDLSVLMGGGRYGLNFAFADSVWNYHTIRDDAAHLDPRSLQHMGDQVLAVARAADEIGVRHPDDFNPVYFDILTWRLVVYPVDVAQKIALFGAVALVAAIFLGIRRGSHDLAAIGRALGVAALTPVVAVVVTGVFWLLVPRAIDRPPFTAWIGLVAAGSTAVLLVQLVLGRINVGDAFAGVGVLLGIFSLASTFFVPEASYLFVWPAIAAALGIVIMRVPSPVLSLRDVLAVLPCLIVTSVLWMSLAHVLLVMAGVLVFPTIAVTVTILALPFATLAARAEGKLRSVAPWTAGLIAVGASAVSWFVR